MSARANGRAIWSCSTRSPTGPADRSYGLAVAKLAGLPPPVLARAKSVLAKLEAGPRRDRRPRRGARRSAAVRRRAMAEEAAPDPVRAALAEIEPDALAPREALELLYRLKRLQAERGG